MRQKEAVPSHEKVMPARTAAAATLAAYCKDIDRWPKSWAGFPDLDVPVGERMVAQMKPFLASLIAAGRTKKTVRRYADSLWVLGGEIIRRVDLNESDRRLSGRALLLKYIDETGGPLWNDARYEREHEDYDAVCRKLHQFLMDSAD
jgi:hypothetical protein